MNKISLILFLLFCLLFIANGLFQGIRHDSWTSLTIAIVVIILGALSMLRKKNK
ncbi:hypothetical protein [Halobacillus yeomjeoni]|uniref:Uncharacterized protein n=1 Tax=Halobacillus yeomjeoni TaxID=311194 RepID=A0A931MVJ8_9BACI|nr:hypothetical protein [Halobacillus yeomjeoni]MBH0230414.1 hypothetical protein [Halobacillus yeomjeoni]